MNPIAPLHRPMTGDDVARRLVELGFDRRSTSDDGRRALFALGELRLVVPLDGRTMPSRVIRMLESMLAPVFGSGSLTIDGHLEAGTGDPPNTIMVLDAAVRADDDGWYAHLLDELAIVGFGSSRTEALRDLKEAAALRLATTPEAIILLTSDVI